MREFENLFPLLALAFPLSSTACNNNNKHHIISIDHVDHDQYEHQPTTLKEISKTNRILTSRSRNLEENSF